MNSQQPIPNLTEEQALRLSGRQDLPSDITSQIAAVLTGMQMRLADLEGGK